MIALLVALLAAFRSSVRSRLELETEILALRHQLAVLQRQAPKRPRLGRVDRVLWVLLSRLWPNWRRAVQIVTPDTVVRWHRRGFARYGRWRSRPRRMGRPAVAVAILDRDGIYGPERHNVTHAMESEERPTAPRSPWQNPFVERVIGSLRRECLDHVIVWNERSLRRHLQQYLAYSHEGRTHRALDKDPPVLRSVQPPTCGTIVQVPHLGGVHHHYERRAASSSLSVLLTACRHSTPGRSDLSAPVCRRQGWPAPRAAGPERRVLATLIPRDWTLFPRGRSF